MLALPDAPGLGAPAPPAPKLHDVTVVTKKNYQCARVEGGGDDARRIFVQSGTLGEIIPKLDELAEKIRLHVSGGHPPVAAAAASTGSGDLGDLQRRVEALERSVFRTGPEQGPSVAPPPKKAASAGAPPVR